MNPSYKTLLALICCLLFASTAHAKTVLPDSCGDDSVKFEVHGEKNQPPPAPPAADKALFVFTNTDRHYTARYGIDGTWVGANQDNSWFAVTVTPGPHHLCMSYQISFGATERIREAATKLLSLTVEAGKTYYFESALGAIGASPGVMVPGAATGGGMAAPTQVGGSPGVPVFSFVPIDEDTGKYHVKAYKLSTWKTK